METKRFISAVDDEKVRAAITEAEKRTSGEIRVFVTKQDVEEPIAAAENEFVRL
jgi:uncharacterized membrane protein